MTLFLKSAAVFLAALVPLIESKGAVVFARMLGLQSTLACALSFAGSYFPVPFLLYSKHAQQFHFKGKRKGLPASFQEYLSRYGCWALLVMIAIPFTGVGCWLAAILALVTHMNRRRAAVCIFIGNLIAVLLMSGCVSSVVAVGRWLTAL